MRESDTLSPLLEGTSQHSYIHRTLFSHHILPKQFFTWNLLTNKRERTTDKMITSKEIKSVLILKQKKCLVFHQPLILHEPKGVGGWGAECQKTCTKERCSFSIYCVISDRRSPVTPGHLAPTLSYGDLFKVLSVSIY